MLPTIRIFPARGWEFKSTPKRILRLSLVPFRFCMKRSPDLTFLGHSKSSCRCQWHYLDSRYAACHWMASSQTKSYARLQILACLSQSPKGYGIPTILMDLGLLLFSSFLRFPRYPYPPSAEHGFQELGTWRTSRSHDMDSIPRSIGYARGASISHRS